MVLLFGAPELHAGSVIPLIPKRRFQLLALLALRSGEWLPRDRIAALFWPDRSNTDARRNLRKVVFTMYELPHAQAVEANEHALRWSVATDLQAFTRALQEGRFGDAVAIRRGPLLAGIDDPANRALADWLAAERSEWHLAWHQAALDDLRQRTQPEQRAAAAAALLQADPLDEAALGWLIDAQLALGRAAQARRSYNDYAARLAEELGVEPARGLRERIATVLSAAAAPPAAPGPAPGDIFIGRRTELAELGAMLADPDGRLLTILGPGGIGKSSLARRAMALIGSRFGGGTLWVEMQDLGDSSAVIARLAQLLEVEINAAGDPLDQLARCLGTERSLLVLDNAEHLADLPALIDRLLAAAASLCLLVTSRARTHCGHERLLPLAGLAVPDEDSRDLEAASAFDAVRLFELRATAARRDFRLAPHLNAVIEITEAVAGLPLAIELAAGWVRLLPPEEIARDLRDSVDLLERDPALRGQPARPEHHSMRAVLERSWQLLAPRERQALAALAVFQGGFTRAAALRVAAVPLPLLSSLADKSLVAAEPGGRFGMHPLVASDAMQRLEQEPGRAAEVRNQHAEFFALHLAALAPHAIGDQRLLVAGMTAEYANCRAAWLYAVAQQRADLVHAMVRALWSFFENRGRLREGIVLLSPALALPEQGPAAQRALARLRHGLSMLHHRKGDAREALELARGGVAGAEHCGDTEAYVGCVLNTGTCLWHDGQVQDAREWFERGLAIARARADRHCIAWSLGNLGLCLGFLGEFDEAQSCLTQALAGSRELGDQYNVGVHLINLGGLLSGRHDWPGALQHFEQALHHCATYGIESQANYLQINLGHLRLRLGQTEAARAHFELALRKGRESSLGVIEWSAERGLAQIEIAAGELSPAIQRLRRVIGHASASLPDVVAAAALYGDVHAARGDAAAAAQVWRMAQAQDSLYPAQRRAVADKLAALPALPPGAAPASALSLDDVLRQIGRQGLTR